ncbi:toprim domain-containing protein [Telluribacter sp. SYSU D00476]|uniref:toprim domain-containing protein n=1 Tax=Telluribacter sp. SYSU D00476 TaxID=2811430 RepID=UPI001FF60391|nr:toprim domain-containing protein [Telluribacter sp. SYSU D00476]
MSHLTFYDKMIIEKVKTIPIVSYLKSVGVEPYRESGSELLYFSPLRNESTPSLFVNTAKNCFTDFGGSEEMKGDNIRLVQLHSNSSFIKAVETLLALEQAEPSSFSFSGLKAQEKAKEGLTIVSVCTLQNPALVQYVKQRGISLELASTYLKEVIYTTKSKRYFAVGFQNDLGGFELRSKYFKGGTSPKWYSTVPGEKENHLNLFEGFFDFLACCQHLGVLRLASPTIVLNSLSLMSKALPTLSHYESINTFLDNDTPGIKAIARLRQHGVQVNDYSYLYTSYKDYSDFLIGSDFTSDLDSDLPTDLDTDLAI